jgi:class 3 adenylate cyclase
MGKLILQHEGTLERFTGDGMMVFLTTPCQCLIQRTEQSE